MAFRTIRTQGWESSEDGFRIDVGRTSEERLENVWIRGHSGLLWIMYGIGDKQNGAQHRHVRYLHLGI